MEHLLQAYAESSDGDQENSTADEGDQNRHQLASSKTSGLGELPADVISMFQDSVYDLATERRRADERASDTQWARRFPHERGNWPTHVFIPVPNATAFVRMAEASVSDFRAKLAVAWRERYSPGDRGGRKRARCDKHDRGRKGSQSQQRRGPPEVVMNDMTPPGQQHLSLSKSVVLRAHQIDPFVNALTRAVKTYRRFTISIVSGYDVLVNEDKSRSFLCLKVRGGRHLVMQLIGKVDPLLERFKQPVYYEDPVVHVSVASVAGDMTEFAGSFIDQLRSTKGSTGARPGTHEEEKSEGDGSGDSSESENEEEQVPSEVCVDVDMVVCKAGTTVFHAPLLPGE